MKYFRLMLLFFLAAVPAYSAVSPTHNEGATVPDAASATTISGQVLVKDKTPMTTGVVLLYDKALGPPPSTKYWRVPDMITGTDRDGRFAIRVPKGVYYLQIAQKKPDGEIGPPQENDYFYSHKDAHEKLLPITITTGSHDLGILKAFLFAPSVTELTQDITSIEGIVIDDKGNPIEKALVFGYLLEGATGRPTFVSERTDKKGKYMLRVHDGGTFYLKVRSVYGGGRPQEGEFLNVTKEFKPLKVSLEKHQKLKGVTLKVIKFSRLGPDSEATSPPPPHERVWKNLRNLQAQ